VACRVSQRTVLAPAGHSSDHQLGLKGQALGGPQPQALHHPRAKALDEDVSGADQLSDNGKVVG